ncbi:MAG: hypothetical protein HOP30_10995 [Cyclobacteriaceae bacterium]|nr:hypothetical protein [Cyclobacteriaceae bacterium]
MTKKIVTKYLIYLLVYVVVVQFIELYWLRLYYTFADNPKLAPTTMATFQAYITILQFVLKVFIVILMWVDVKGAKLIDWLIMAITLFAADIGIVLFIAWTLYQGKLQADKTQQI